MREIPARPSFHAATAVLALGVALAASPAPAYALAGLFGRSLTGFADVSAVQGETQGLETETLRQEYSLFWRRPLLPYLNLDASFRYLDYDVQLQQTAGSYRKEVQPALELGWRHPLFQLSAGGVHRRTETVVSQGDLVSDSYLVSFRTRDSRYPVLTARYDWRQSREGSGERRDSRDRNLQAGLTHTAGKHTLSYLFSRGASENVISGLESNRTSHLLRWSGTMTALPRQKLRLSSYYSLGHSIHADRAREAGGALEAVPTPAGLFAVDPSPSLGELEPLPGLVDGDLDRATTPPVAIGAGAVDRNVGVDLGARREVAAVYLQTDGPSGDGLAWRPWISDDGLTWEPLAGSLSRFNPLLSRYEVTFPPALTRYVKVVNAGLNEVIEVAVTEIRVFRPLDAAEGRDRAQTEQLADLRAGYRFSPSLDGTLDLAWRSSHGEAAPDLNRSADYATRLRWRQGGALVHNLRWGQSFQNMQRPGQDLREDVASYALGYDPLATLGTLLTVSRRETHVGSVRDVRTDGVLARVQGEPVYRLLTTLETGWSRIDQALAASRLDTWTYRAALDGALTPSLNGTLAYQQQESESRTHDFHRTRRVTTLGLSYRVTRTIFARADLHLVDDPGQNLTQDLLLSWNLTPRLTVSGQAMLNDAPGLRTTRYGVNANLEINPRSSLYFSFARVDFTEAGGNDTSSFQQGMRIGL